MIVKSVFGTHPLVIHAPDRDQNPFWPTLVRGSQQKTRALNSDDLTIVTWNNLEEGDFEKSLKSQNTPFVLKGNTDNIWSNYNKFKYNLEVARDCGTKYLMGCDSHDVVMMGNPAEIVQKFEQMDCQLLFNCEKKFYPNFSEPVLQGWKRFEESVARSQYAYLNAGAWIGNTDFCLQFFERANQIRVYDLFDCEPYKYLKKSSIGCDQSSLHHVFPEFYPEVGLDYMCEIFLNISFPNDNEISFEVKML